jgi:acyl-CoA thioesterase
MTYELDEDTALEPAGPGRWRGRVTGRWGIGGGPNGGYIAAILARALMAEAAPPQPLTMTIHYVERPVVAPVTVEVETVRVGRSHATLSARLVQDRPVAVALATFGRHRPDERQWAQAAAADYPDPARCVEPARMPVPPGTTPAGTEFRDRFQVRVAEPGDLFYGRERPGPALTRGWTRLADGRPTDDLAVPLLMDSFPPAIFSAFFPDLPAGFGAPTLELTVHWRSQPRTDWHLARFSTRLLTGGYVEEDGELWGEDGVLVAESRQLARFVAPG